MSRASQFATHGYSLADAQHVLKAAGKHWAALQALGATETERKRFTATIAEASRLALGQNPGPIALEEARQALKDQIGAYRSAASLVVFGIDGRDLKVEQALQMKGPFPATDLLLGSYTDGLGAKMKPYSARLATRGFSKEKQAQLIEAGKAFNQAFASRGKERGAARAETLARETVFKQLRTETSYFRKLGHEALRNSISRAEFDRVRLPSKPASSVAPPAPPAPAPAKSAVG